MPCISVPDLTPPTLPLPFTLEPPALPSFDLSVDLCCRFALTITPPPLPIPTLTLLIPGASSIIIAMNAAFEVIDTYLDELAALAPPCPFD